MDSETDAALISTVNRVLLLTEDLILANIELRHVLRGALFSFAQPKISNDDVLTLDFLSRCRSSEPASTLSLSLLSSLESLSLTPETSEPLLPHHQGNTSSSVPVTPARPVSSSRPHAWQYGPEIPTPQAIAIKVRDIPEGPTYVVTVGTAVGVFSTWALASLHVNGVSCNSHKVLPSRQAAVDYWTAAYNDVSPRPLIRIVKS
ncbi:hypothetical protein C8J56DRAFT_1068104 [Mycena floridula]|nr:hypothetical protein C8J56DRAFT_1068104 [Mycena floridula]